MKTGIQCRHCKQFPAKQRTRGAVYYPGELARIYQAAQNMAKTHLCQHCMAIPGHIKHQLNILREQKSAPGAGKQYWGDSAQAVGVEECENGLRFTAVGQRDASEKSD